jgi:hypothetical protein
MAETTITPTAMTAGTAIVVTAGIGTAIDTANTMIVAYPKQGKLILYCDSNHADTAATFTAGVGVSAGLGSFEWAVGDTVAQMIMLDSDRLVDEDGNLEITWATNSAGFLTAWYTI